MPCHALAAGPRAGALTLLAFAAAVYATALVVVRTGAFAERPAPLAFGVAADLTFLVPLAYWLLVVRRGGAAVTSIVPVVALSVLGAMLVLPAGHRSFVGPARYAVAPLELAVVGYGVWSARRALRAARARGGDRDAAEALEEGFVAALGERAAARLLAAEAATLHYALFARATGVAVRADAAVFSQGRGRSAATTWGLALVVAVEAAVVHVWLAPSHAAAAWGLTALSAYSLLWLAGHHRAVALRPVVLEGDTLALRAGLRLTARVPLAAVAAAEAVTWRTVPRRRAGYLDAAQPAEPNVVLTFNPRPPRSRAHSDSAARSHASACGSTTRGLRGGGPTPAGARGVRRRAGAIRGAARRGTGTAAVARPARAR
jgi:hypothetical protein